MSKINADRKREIKEANKFFRIRANANFSSSLNSKRNFLFTTEFHAKILVLAKLYKLINNSKQFFCEAKTFAGSRQNFYFLL